MSTALPPRTRRVTVTATALGLAATVLLSSCSMRDGGESTAGDQDNELTADCVDYRATQGITEDSIKIGTSLPVTGALATAGTGRFGMEAYFEHINETEGGVDGRELELVVRDDGYDPAKTTANVNQLLNEEEVFAMLTILGTANVLAVQQDLQDACVPNLLVGSGSPAAADPSQTWTVPGLPSYTLEADVLAQTAVEAGATSVAVISQNDDFGRAYVTALTDTLETAGVKVVEEVTYDVGAPTVGSEVTKAAASDADAVLVAALGTKCPQILNGIAASGWDPMLLVGSLCTSKALLGLLGDGAGDGMLSTAWYKSPGDPQWADDEAISVYREALAAYAPEANADEDFVLTGWLWAQLLVEILKTADELDRAGVMEAARNADLSVDSMLDGIEFQTGPERLSPITELQVVRYAADSGRLQFVDPTTGEDLAPGTTALTEGGAE